MVHPSSSAEADLQHASAALQRLSATSSQADLDAAATAWAEVVSNPDFDGWPLPLRTLALNNAGVTQLMQFQRHSSADALDGALLALRRLAAILPPDSPDASHVLPNLAAALHMRFARTRELHDLDEAIGVLDRAVAAAPNNAANLTLLAACLDSRAEITGSQEALVRATTVAGEAFRLSAADDPDRQVCRDRLTQLVIRQLRSHVIVDGLDPSVELGVEPIAELLNDPDMPSDRAELLGYFAFALRARFKRSAQPADQDKVVAALDEALGLTAESSPDWPPRASNLSTVLVDRFARSRQRADIHRAVELAEAALAAAGPSVRSMCLSNLANVLRARYEATRDPLDFARAGELVEEALALGSADAEEGTADLRNVGVVLLARYRHFGDPADLARAVEAYERLYELPSTQSDAADRLGGLGAALGERYFRTGDADTLTRGIEMFERVLTLPASPATRAQQLSNYSISLRDRYHRMGQLADLDRVIEVLEQAITLAPDDAQRRTLRTGLAAALRDRFRRTRLDADIDRALELGLQACRGASLNDPALPIYFTDVGASYIVLEDTRDSARALDLALEVFEEALVRTRHDAPDYPHRLGNVGDALARRYRRRRDPVDYERAALALREVLERLPPTSPQRSQSLVGWGSLCKVRHEVCGASADLAAAQQAFDEAARIGLDQAPGTALTAAAEWGLWAFGREAWAEAAQAFDLAQEASDRLLAVQLERSGKEAWLNTSSVVAGRAAYARARAGDPNGAVTALEHSRVRLLGEVLERDRTSLAELEATHPDLLRSYRQVIRRIDDLQSQASEPAQTARAVVVEQLREAHAELTRLIEQIREVPGHEQFFRPVTFAAVQATAALVPLVYLVTTGKGGLALIVRATGVEPVWLDFDDEALSAMLFEPLDGPPRGAYLLGQFAGFDQLGERLANTLAWLGERLMAPVAAALRSGSPGGVLDRSDRKPEVVLIPTGRLSLLPLHAASYVVDGQELCVLDEFEVSYAPSAQVLGYARAAAAARHGRPRVLAGVGNPQPEDPPLLLAREELERIACLFPDGAAQPLYEQAATRTELLRRLPGATYVHFACHGVFDMAQPLRSHLRLGGGQRLLLSELLDQQLFRDAELVVLSACQTAMIDFAHLPDEAIGLPSASLQAGAPRVLGNLWPVNDASTALLMEDFYRYLLLGVEGSTEPVPPAAALRMAQRHLRSATAAELDLGACWERVYEASQRSDAEAFQRARYFKRHPDVQPFRQPYYWAAFVLSGA